MNKDLSIFVCILGVVVEAILIIKFNREYYDIFGDALDQPFWLYPDLLYIFIAIVVMAGVVLFVGFYALWKGGFP